MIVAPGGGVSVHADLDVEVDGHTVDVTADGDRIRVTVSDPAAVARLVTTTPLPVGSASPFTRRTLGRVADTLTDGGLTLTVVGPHGPLATLGAGARPSRWTGRLLGNSHVALGAWSSLRPTLRPVLTSAVQRVRAAVAARLRRR